MSRYSTQQTPHTQSKQNLHVSQDFADKENMSVLNQFDFQAIDEMDPSLAEGHRLVFDREVPFELRIHDGDSGPQEIGTLEAIRVKILALSTDGSYLQNIKIELTSENDLFFHYSLQLDEESFKSMQDTQKLTIDFSELSQIVIKMLNSCIREPHSFLAVFVMQRDGRATLDFIQNIEYKFIELLSLQFMASSEEIIRQSITFRYNSVKSKVSLMQARLADVNNMVKVKSPSLLLQIQKTQGSTQRGGPMQQSSVMRSRTNL